MVPGCITLSLKAASLMSFPVTHFTTLRLYLGSSTKTMLIPV